MANPTESAPVVIVGAGLAGLAAARVLAEGGRPAVVLEAGATPGGRLRTEMLDGATVDHGAQFFTVRSPDFAAVVDTLVAAGDVVEWCRGFNEVDGYPRFAGPSGMAGIATALARGLNVVCGAPVRAVRQRGTAWSVDTDTGSRQASAVLLTPPVPVSASLCDAGAVPVDPAVRAVAYHRVLALVLVLNGPPAVGEPGARQLEAGPFSFVADNARKGISPRFALTLHASHALSAQLWDDDDTVVRPALCRLAEPWVGGATVLGAHLRRWPHSGPVTPWPTRCAEVAPGLLFAGDAFGGPKVEGAYLSGRAAGQALLTV